MTENMCEVIALCLGEDCKFSEHENNSPVCKHSERSVESKITFCNNRDAIIPKANDFVSKHLQWKEK